MKIKIVRGEQEGEVFRFDDVNEIIAGREAACNIVLKDAESSRRHVKIFAKARRVFIVDLDSRNGTSLNGRKIQEAELADRDQILIGHTVLEVSELRSHEVDTATALHMSDKERSVVMAVPHEEADILVGKTMSESTAQMAHENVILREICRISQLVAMEKDAQSILVSVLDRLLEVLEADTACILDRSDGEGEWKIVATSGSTGGAEAIRVSQTIINEAVREGSAILSADPMTDKRFAPSQSIVSQKISCALCSPLKVGGRFRGVLSIDRRERRRVFSPMDLRLAASAGNILGLFIEKQEYERESRQKARLAVIGEVVAGLAHYIKNVVTGFRLSIEALKAALKEKRMDYVESFAQSISVQEGRISDLMLNMLSYAKDREPVRSRLQVAEVVASAADPYRPQFEKEGISFEFNSNPDTPQVYAEEMALHRAFLNLITNAKDSVIAKKNGGEKMIRASIDPLPDGGGADIRIHDTGCGIPEEKRNKIFEAFFSTKGADGTGLGLAVVRKIVGEHGGEISVDSEENEWTEFRITLPAAGNQDLG